MTLVMRSFLRDFHLVARCRRAPHHTLVDITYQRFSFSGVVLYPLFCTHLRHFLETFEHGRLQDKLTALLLTYEQSQF